MMLLATDSLTHLAEQVGLVAAILAGLGVIGAALRKLLQVIRKIARAYEWLEAIYIQLTPDAGMSLHDVIHRLDENDLVNHRNVETVYGVVLKGHDVDPEDAPLLEVLKPGPLLEQEPI